MATAEETKPQAETAAHSEPADIAAPYDAAGLAGKTVLITGGASGFGAAFARAWAKHGANIIIGDLNDAAGEELVAELRSASGSENHHFEHCDVTDWQSQVSLFQAAARLSPTGGIDAVVPNAGIGDDGGKPGFEMPEDLDDESPPPPRLKILDVNLTGVMYTVHLALFWLPRNTPAKSEENGQANGSTQPEAEKTWRDRHLLLIGSIASLMPLVGSAQYTASKHAVAGLFRSLRGTAFFRGIRVNMLCPYFVDTDLVGNSVMFALAGGGLGQMADVVDAGTRFMADEGLMGRAVVVGPRLKVDDGGEDSQPRLVEIPPSEGDEGQGVWECYAHDYVTAEAFVYRYARLLTAYARMRGWLGWWRDIFWISFLRKPGKK